MAHDVQMVTPIDSFIAAYDGIEYTYRPEERYRSDTPRIQGILQLFKPVQATFIEVESASAAPGEKRGQQ